MRTSTRPPRSRSTEYEQERRGDAVHVVVAVDEDALAGRKGPLDARHRHVEVPQQEGVVQVLDRRDRGSAAPRPRSPSPGSRGRARRPRARPARRPAPAPGRRHAGDEAPTRERRSERSREAFEGEHAARGGGRRFGHAISRASEGSRPRRRDCGAPVGGVGAASRARCAWPCRRADAVRLQRASNGTCARPLRLDGTRRAPAEILRRAAAAAGPLARAPCVRRLSGGDDPSLP